MDEERQRRRALGASALVAGMLAMAAVAGALGREPPPQPPAATGRAASLARAALGGEEAWADAVPGYREGSAAPDWFAEELFAPEGALASYADEDGRVVGFSFPGSAADCAAMVAEAMGERGWLGVPSGVEGCVTFVRGEGSCRWAMVSCVDVPGGTSVVVQVQRASWGRSSWP
ncbi:hypothetical protein [Adlercreutzia faecimuris]|uniref:Tat pathway signal protein n=1 Tax=Adlercreutzia faecimuris TaxID=2897341 RepID=A0ABS9WIR5_9ACTN|nr:hypothetical protein [Adlercreutzia sp. JBNU-10]MCI2242771.1 hypothetical protein [Adlercreutzia sp. JBNU-10]